jgi:hypothetical protein
MPAREDLSELLRVPATLHRLAVRQRLEVVPVERNRRVRQTGGMKK